MAGNNWNNLGEQIRDAVDSAVSTGDFTDLSRSIGDLVNNGIDAVKYNVKTTAQKYNNTPYVKPVNAGPAALYKTRTMDRVVGILCTVLGFPLLAVGLILLIIFSIANVFVSGLLAPMVIFSILSAFGLGLGIFGIQRIGFADRFQK